MSISSAQMVSQVASAQSPAKSSRSAPGPPSASIQPADPAAPATASSSETTASTPVVSPPEQFSTDLQIDNHHQIYYIVVDDSTGDVLFEIPPEALRQIGESLNVPLVGDQSIPNVDVKS
jgi:hypothetical protein